MEVFLTQILQKSQLNLKKIFTKYYQSHHENLKRQFYSLVTGIVLSISTKFTHQLIYDSLLIFYSLFRMIYTKTSFKSRQRILSEQDTHTIKSPARIIRISTSPNRYNCLPIQKTTKEVITQPYTYQPPIQSSSNKLTYLARSPQKIIHPQIIHVNTKPPAPSTLPLSSSSNKTLTLRQRLWTKHKVEPLQEYNIWEGYQSQTSIPDAPELPKSNKVTTMKYKPQWNFQKKSISEPIQPPKQMDIKKIVTKNEFIRSPKGHKSPLSVKPR